MNPKFLHIIPNMEPDEAVYLDSVMLGMSENQQEQFMQIYSGRRIRPELLLLVACLGFFGFNGIHRFLMGQIGMGILYFLTGGLCLIGTILDIVNYKKLAFEYNQQKAQESLNFARSFNAS